MIKHPDDHVTFNGQFSGVSRPRPWFLAPPKRVCKDPPTTETSQVVLGQLAHHSRKGSWGRRKWYLRRSTARDKIRKALIYILLASRAAKMNQILCCYSLHQRARWDILPYREKPNPMLSLATPAGEMRYLALSGTTKFCAVIGYTCGRDEISCPIGIARGCDPQKNLD